MNGCVDGVYRLSCLAAAAAAELAAAVIIVVVVAVVVAAAVVVFLGFMALLTSQVIRIAFYSEREKSDKFCSEALISA